MTPYKEHRFGDGWEPAHIDREEAEVHARFLSLDFYVWYDRETRTWECSCPVFGEEKTCRHVGIFRRYETIDVNGEYL